MVIIVSISFIFFIELTKESNFSIIFYIRWFIESLSSLIILSPKSNCWNKNEYYAEYSLNKQELNNTPIKMRDMYTHTAKYNNNFRPPSPHAKCFD